jgi:histidinol dehydrogenase
MNKNKTILLSIAGVIALASAVMAYLDWSAYSAKTAALEGDDMEGIEGLESVIVKAEKLSRKEIVDRVIDRGGILIVVAENVKEGLEVVNRFAPEHFEIMTSDALKVMKGVRSAGAVFAGPWTPESAGDFVAGPSHVLPTGGAADMFNGLTPDDFRRRHSFVAFTKEDLKETRSTIEAFAAVEGLDAHGRAATIRFE